jgi:pyruvate/2-oxoglutarate dehydrogenase complex dihydrolipoamide acyltransferase (E2) component
MARIDVVMPQMGESIAEGTIVKWHKRVGDRVMKDEVLLEISTDKVDSEIPSPAAGVLSQIVVQEQQTVPVQTVIAHIESEPGAPSLNADDMVAPPPAKAAPPAAPRGAGAAHAPGSPAAGAPPVTAAGSRPAAPEPTGATRVAAGRFYSPLVLSIARAEGIGMDELEAVPGTGEGGRLTKKDLLAYVAARARGGPAPAAAGPAPPPITAKPVDAPELRAKYPSPAYDILQMNNVMQKMAQHMIHSVQTSPHVAAVHEVDMTTVARHRSEHAAEFERREGFKLTFTAYIAYAVVQALKKFPLVNASVEGDKIIKKNFVNLGIAVASDNGLIVPVIRHAEEKNFLGVARAINDLAMRTRAKKLTPDDITGGTFTISNFGVFGTLMGTPIISQPQVAILGTGAVKKRVAVINDAIAIRSIAYFTMSFDHRIIDGALGGMFMEEIVRALEQFDPATKV